MGALEIHFLSFFLHNYGKGIYEKHAPTPADGVSLGSPIFPSLRKRKTPSLGNAKKKKTSAALWAMKMLKQSIGE